jgi:hypothetical protein
MTPEVGDGVLTRESITLSYSYPPSIYSIIAPSTAYAHSWVRRLCPCCSLLSF